MLIKSRTARQIDARAFFQAEKPGRPADRRARVHFDAFLAARPGRPADRRARVHFDAFLAERPGRPADRRARVHFDAERSGRPQMDARVLRVFVPLDSQYLKATLWNIDRLLAFRCISPLPPC